MDFAQLGNIAGGLVKAGAPILGTVLGAAIGMPGLGGMLGQAAGAMIGGTASTAATGMADSVLKMAADALGVPKTMDAIAGALAQAPDVLKAKFQAAEAEAAAKWPAQAEIARAHAEVAKAQVEATQRRMQGELDAAQTITWRWMRNLILLAQTLWRPSFAVLLLVECWWFSSLLYYILTDVFVGGNTGHIAELNSLQGFLMVVFAPLIGAQFAVVGVYMKQRTNEKIARLSKQAGGFDLGKLAEGLLDIIKTKGA